MVVPKNFAEHAEKFFASNVTTAKQLELASEVRASIEIAHTSEYANWLKAYFEVFSKLLKANRRRTARTPGKTNRTDFETLYMKSSRGYRITKC